MEREEEFERDFSDAVKEALRIETAWKGNNEARKAAVDRIRSDVPRSCAYRGMGWKRSKSYFSKKSCDRCNASLSSSLTRSSICAGCRHNGDGYGSDVYYCTTCGLFDWDSYDEA